MSIDKKSLGPEYLSDKEREISYDVTQQICRFVMIIQKNHPNFTYSELMHHAMDAFTVGLGKALSVIEIQNKDKTCKNI